MIDLKKVIEFINSIALLEGRISKPQQPYEFYNGFNYAKELIVKKLRSLLENPKDQPDEIGLWIIFIPSDLLVPIEYANVFLNCDGFCIRRGDRIYRCDDIAFLSYKWIKVF